MTDRQALNRLAGPVLLVRGWPLSAKVMAAIAIALLPLGLLALGAAIANYRTVTESQDRLARTRVGALREAAAPRLDEALLAIRAAPVLEGSPGCAVGLAGMARATKLVTEIALFDASFRPLCTASPKSGAMTMAAAARQAAAGGDMSFVDPERRDLLLVARQSAEGGQGVYAVGRIPGARAGEQLIERGLLGPGDRVVLSVGGVAVAETGTMSAAGTDWSRASAPLYGGLSIRLMSPRAPVTSAQGLGVVLPALMWLTAVSICWVALGTIVVQPLRRMQAAVEAYRRGDRTVRAMPAAGSGRELQEFARAFDRMADEADAHEAAMQAALLRQTALTREVHHRVKNNLQIVSSLLSIQARGVANPEVAAAYAQIRQRVTALSLVHRWIYADRAEAGVDLRGLLTDLCANLAQSIDRDGRRPDVSCRAGQLLVDQDTALPLALLISEFASAVADGGGDSLTVVAERDGDSGKLQLLSPAFEGEAGRYVLAAGSERIVAGLTRQLRSELRHDAQGSFAVRFALFRAKDA